MSKLTYPADGIYNYCRDNIESCVGNLSQAVSNSSLDVPSRFAYRNYLNSLYGVLSEYKKEIGSIKSKLKQSNDNFNALSDELEDSVKKMTVTKIKERDRMII